MIEFKFSDWQTPKRQRILHCLRAPVGGLFRHVVDLATAQSALGHEVGLICAATGDRLTEARLQALAPALRLGLHRLPMGREIGFGDVRACRQTTALARTLNVSVLHGHGAKGGAYARLAARSLKRPDGHLRCFYTPHGGTLHYAASTLMGQIYGGLEQQLESWTDGILFESQFAAHRYAEQIGKPACAWTVVVNGVTLDEFKLVPADTNAADFVFVGELRMLKGVDVALEALALVNRMRPASAVFVGDGPDAARFKEQAFSLGLADRTRFPGAMRARDAFALGRTLLMPSRAESLPYIILEAIAAEVPVIATRVGGIPEIIPDGFGPLLPAGDATALAAAMQVALDRPNLLRSNAAALQRAIRHRFTVNAMSEAITAFYDSFAEQRMVA